MAKILQLHNMIALTATATMARVLTGHIRASNTIRPKEVCEDTDLGEVPPLKPD